jgi:hypothetical protein
VVGHVAGLLQESHPAVEGISLRDDVEILEQEGDPAKRAVRQRGRRGVARFFEERRDHRVQLAIGPLDARDGFIDELEGRDASTAHQFSGGGRIEGGEVIGHFAVLLSRLYRVH